MRESRGIGKEERVWELTEKGLSIGRSSDSDIELLVSRIGGH